MNRVHYLNISPSELPGNFWDSSDCEVLIAQKWAAAQADEAQWIGKNLPTITGHVWISSSGTLAIPGQSKWIALSKKALLTSAQAVNTHISIKSTESWGLTLPLSHVGGLGIVARAHLLGQKISCPTEDKWNPISLKDWNGNLLSLVPTQVYDLVKNKIKAPPSLRAVIVGGDRLDEELKREAQLMGWPLHASYGLTECCSQVATELVGDKDEFSILPHIKANVDEDNRLWIESPSLFTGQALVNNSKIDYTERSGQKWGTEDLAQISNGKLKILGRRDSIIKIRGEKVDLPALELALQKYHPNLVVLNLPDERDGFKLWAVSEKELTLEHINSGLLPHQKISTIKTVELLPRTALGKVKRGELLEWIKTLS